MEAGRETQKCKKEGRVEEGYIEHTVKRRLKGRVTERRRRAAGEMIMIGTTNGEFIYTVERNSPGG